MSNPLETYRWDRKHMRSDAHAFKAFSEVFDYAEALQAELDAVRHAAHMPEDYPHGLPSWINQGLYGRLMQLMDRDGGPVRRTEDILELGRSRQLLLDLWLQFADQRPDGSRHSGGLDVLYGLRIALQEAGLIDEEGRRT